MSNRLPILAARINEEHAAVGSAVQRGLAHAMAAGDLLHEAKTSMPHGSWGNWLKAHCAIPDRTARLYMRLARNRASVEAESATVAEMTVRHAATILATRKPNFRDMIEDVETTVAEIQRAEKLASGWAEQFGALAAAYELAPMWQAAYTDLAAALNGLERAVELADSADQLKLTAMWAEISAAAAGRLHDQSRSAIQVIEAFCSGQPAS